MSSHSQRLRAKTRLIEPSLVQATGLFWNHPQLAQLIPEYLIALYGVIRSSVPLLELCTSICRSREDEDPLAALLVDYYAEHAEEERDHDRWLLEDLEVLGISRTEVGRRIPSPTIAGLVGSQYYWIHYHHPAALMGYMAVVEGPADTTYYDQVIENTGLPRAAFRTLLEHAVLDAGHEEDIDEQLDRLPLTPEQESLLGVSALETVASLSQMFRELVATFERRAPS